MLTPAQEQALQAQMLATGAGGAPAPVATTALPTPTPGEIFPSVTTSMPISSGSSSSWTEKKEGAEAQEKRRAADTADVAAVDALKAATLGTTEAPTAPAKVAEVPTVAPTGEGLGGGIQQGATLPEQKQINALAIATKQKEFEDAKQKALAEREQRRAAAMKGFNDEIASVRAEYAKTAAEPTQDNSWTSRLLRGLAAGLGAYGAAITHSPNYAQQILDSQVNQAIELKRDKMRQLESRLEKLGAKPEVIDKTIDREWALTLGQLQANLDRVKTAADVTLARFPQAQLEANKMIAEKQAVVASEAAKRSATVGERTVGGGTNTPASMVQTVQPGSDKEMGGRALANEKGALTLANAKEEAKKADRLEWLINHGHMPTPDQISGIQDRQNKIIARQEEEKKSAGASTAGQLMRAVDLLPSSVFPEGMSKEQKEAYTLQWQLAEPQAIRSTGGITWMTNPEAYYGVIGKRVQMRGEDTEMGQMKNRQLIDDTRAALMELEKVSKAGVQERRQDAMAARTAPSKATLAQQYMEAKRVKPGDPDYDEAQAFIKKAAKALGGK